MSKKIQFKNPEMVLFSPGMGRITNDNLTEEKYNRLLQLSAAHAEFFEYKEVADAPMFISSKDSAPEKKTSKTNKNESTI